MKNIILHFITLSILFLIVGSTHLNAQCGRFTKKESLPKLENFTHNGQLNSAKLFAGDEAELYMTFYSGHLYRILVDNQPILGNAVFKVYDKKKNLLYDSQREPGKQYWDFNVEKSQQLKIVVSVPQSENQNNIKLTENGCVSILIGFKTEKQIEKEKLLKAEK